MDTTTTYSLLEKEGAQPVVRLHFSPLSFLLVRLTVRGPSQTYPDAAHRRDELPSRITPKERLVVEQERIKREGPTIDSQTHQTGAPLASCSPCPAPAAQELR